MDEASEYPATARGFVVSVTVSNDRQHLAVLYARYTVRATGGVFSRFPARCLGPVESQVYDLAGGRRCGPRVVLDLPQVCEPLFGRWSSDDAFIVYSDLAFANVCVVPAP
jgi:hypothetical protein